MFALLNGSYLLPLSLTSLISMLFGLVRTSQPWNIHHIISFHWLLDMKGLIEVLLLFLSSSVGQRIHIQISFSAKLWLSASPESTHSLLSECRKSGLFGFFYYCVTLNLEAYLYFSGLVWTCVRRRGLVGWKVLRRSNIHAA